MQVIAFKIYYLLGKNEISLSTLPQVREAESEQALNRLRLLRGEGKEKQVYVLSNVALNVTIDFWWVKKNFLWVTAK